MNKYKFLAIILISLITFSQCTIKTTKSIINPQEEDFNVFLEKFLTDSTFQISRIVFPVKGLPASATRQDFENSYYWTIDNWNIHVKVDYKTEGYKRIIQKDAEIIREQLINPQGWFLERRFKKTDSQWFLIYYSSMNSISLME